MYEPGPLLPCTRCHWHCGATDDVCASLRIGQPQDIPRQLTHIGLLQCADPHPNVGRLLPRGIGNSIFAETYKQLG